MLLRVLFLTVIAATLVASGVGTAGEKGEKGKDDKKLEKKEKGKEKKDEPKVELKYLDGVVKSVSFDKASFTITADGKDRTFAVNESTKFVGPKGGSRGMGKVALKDETMAAGNKVRVGLLTAEDKAALEVYLPARGTTAAKVTPPGKKVEDKQPGVKKPDGVPQPQPQATAPAPQPEFQPFEPGPRVGPFRRLLRRVLGRQ